LKKILEEIFYNHANNRASGENNRASGENNRASGENNRASGDIMHNRWWSEAEPPVNRYNNFEPR
jgi:hypothetical protein